jgi:beta-hydroxyacyl-ACP dehydratase FabZ
MKILPHRYPFLFVDRIIHLDGGKKAVGIKNVTINENYFTGHFPTRPVMPGVLMVEALAQVGGILVLTNPAHHGKVALFMAVDKVKFRKLVVPGEQLTLEVEMIRDRSKTSLLKGIARVGEEIVVEAELMVSFLDADFLKQT